MGREPAGPGISRRQFMGRVAQGGVLVAVSPVLIRELGLPSDAAAGVLAEVPLSELVTRDIILRMIDVALSRGGEYADVYAERLSRTEIRMENEAVSSVQYGLALGVGVRVIADERTGFAFSESLEEDALLGTSRTAAAIADGEARSGPKKLESMHYPSVVGVGTPVDQVEASHKLVFIEKAATAARRFHPAISHTSIRYYDWMKSVVMGSSDGDWVTDRSPMAWMDVTSVATKGTRRATGYTRAGDQRGMDFLTNQSMEGMGIRAGRQAVRMLEARPAPAGEMTVVLGAGGGVLFHEAVGHGMEGDAVARGSSCYTGRLGEKVGTSLVNLVDDPTVPDLRGSYNVDDECVVPQRILLIEDGVLNTYMLDRLSSTQLKMKSNGHGRRESYKHHPLVRMSNTFLLPGEDTVEDIIAGTPQGLYAAELGGGEVDPASGNFTFGVREAYAIEDGKITHPVKGATLIGKGEEVLARIDRLGADLKFWPGTCGKGQWVPITSGAPTLRISRITVGGTG